jgi:hypothetical protein
MLATAFAQVLNPLFCMPFDIESQGKVEGKNAALPV